VLRVPVVHGGGLLVLVGEEHTHPYGRLDDQVRLGEQQQASLLSYLAEHYSSGHVATRLVLRIVFTDAVAGQTIVEQYAGWAASGLEAALFGDLQVELGDLVSRLEGLRVQ